MTTDKLTADPEGNRCCVGNCLRRARYVVTHNTVEGIKELRYCEGHRDLVLRSENAYPGNKSGEELGEMHV